MEVFEKHDKLFHYTNSAGLIGILENQSLHATHYKYSNDDMEIAAIRPVLKNYAASAFRRSLGHVEHEGSPDEIALHCADKFIDDIYAVTFGAPHRKHKFFEPYITSFCGHTGRYERDNGLLSMWRGYGRESGYAIVFDTVALVGLLKSETELHNYDLASLGDVVYANDEAELKSEFPNLEAAISNAVLAVNGGQSDQLEALFSEFATSASRYKHQGFQEEQEVRLIISPRDRSLTQTIKTNHPTYIDPHQQKRQKTILFKQNLAAYLDVFRDLDSRSLPIHTIIVGPHTDKERRRERLIKYLELKGLPIEVRCSETPFV
jgi:hypothetical protein